MKRFRRAFPFFIITLNILALNLSGQRSYDMMIIKNDYCSILEQSAELSDTADFFYHSYALDKTGKISEAIKTLKTGLEKYPETGSLQIALSDLYFRTGQYASAKPLLTANQENNEQFIRLVKVIEFESDYRQVISMLEKRLEKDSLNVEYMIRLGDNYESVDKLLSARNLYNKIIELNPDDVVTMSKLANIYLKTEDYQSAIMLCDEALVMDTLNRTLLKIQGIAAFRSGEFDLAETNFEKLLGLGDTTLITLKHLGISEVKGYDFTGALKHLHMARLLDTTDYELYFFLGRSYMNSEEPEKGMYYLDMADTLLQPSPAIMAAVFAEKASLYYELKQYDDAFNAYRIAYQYKPRPEYLFFMGSLCRFQLNDSRQALSYYEKFLEALNIMNNNKEVPHSSSGISMKHVAEESIEILREELFFKGELDE